MSLVDKSYCSTECEQKRCARNLKYNTPIDKYYSATTFDDLDENGNPKTSHEDCKWMIIERSITLPNRNKK